MVFYLIIPKRSRKKQKMEIGNVEKLVQQLNIDFLINMFSYWQLYFMDGLSLEVGVLTSDERSEKVSMKRRIMKDSCSSFSSIQYQRWCELTGIREGFECSRICFQSYLSSPLPSLLSSLFLENFFSVLVLSFFSFFLSFLSFLIFSNFSSSLS